jgi:3-oxoadipate enol-lactonase
VTSDPQAHRNLLVRFLLAAAFLAATSANPAHSQKLPSPKPVSQKPAPIEKHTGYLNVGDSKIYYEECGAGAAVVLLHDGLLHSVTWNAEWESLCRKYHAVRYDRRGYGKSEAPKNPFSPTDDLAALLAHLKITRAVLVGSSSGSALAIDFALAHPEMMEGLLLLGPVVHGMEVSAAFEQRINKNNAPTERGDENGAAENWSKDPYILGEGHEPARKKLYELLADSPQDLKYTGEFEIKNSPEASSRLSEIHVPTLVLVGELDISDVHAQAGAIEAGISGAQRDVIVNAGHLIQLEQPEILIERIDRFVDLQERKSMNVAAETLRAYAGQYNSADGVVTIAVDSGHLTAQMPGQPPFPLFAASQSKFFLRVAEVEIEFTKNAAGKVTQIIIYQDGTETKAPHI